MFLEGPKMAAVRNVKILKNNIKKIVAMIDW
jgi:hypothetical protein